MLLVFVLVNVSSIELDQIDFHYSILRVMGKGRKERIVPFGQYAHDASTTIY